MKMLLLLGMLLLGMFLLSACSPQSDGKPWGVIERCIKGVTYYVSGYQLAPAYKTDGSLYLCNK